MSAIPTSELGHGEEGGCEEEKKRGVSPRGAAAGVGRFGFGCFAGRWGVSGREKGRRVMTRIEKKKMRRRMMQGRVRKASNVRRPSVKPFFSPNAASSRPWSWKPFIEEANRSSSHANGAGSIWTCSGSSRYFDITTNWPRMVAHTAKLVFSEDDSYAADRSKLSKEENGPLPPHEVTCMHSHPPISPFTPTNIYILASHYRMAFPSSIRNAKPSIRARKIPGRCHHPSISVHQDLIQPMLAQKTTSKPGTYTTKKDYKVSIGMHTRESPLSASMTSNRISICTREGERYRDRYRQVVPGCVDPNANDNTSGLPHLSQRLQSTYWPRGTSIASRNKQCIIGPKPRDRSRP